MIARLAHAGDVEGIVEMAGNGVRELWNLHMFDDAKYRRTVENSMASANPIFWIAEGKDGPCGFLEGYAYEYNFTSGVFTVPHVTYVRPEKRGTRAAALLIGMFVRWSDQLGAKESIGGNSNGYRSEHTARFLSRFGFEACGICMRRQPTEIGR